MTAAICVVAFGFAALIVISLSGLHGKVDCIMAGEQDLQNDLDAIKAGVTTVVDKLTTQAATIKSLSDQIATGTPVSQEQLDALHTEASEIAAALASATA